MEITVEQIQEPAVTVMRLDGQLDGSNYRSVIAKASDLYGQGSRRLIVDLRSLSFMSSAGLTALHSMALQFSGEPPVDPDSGWEALRTVGRARDAGIKHQVKLVAPQPSVANSLEITGMDAMFDFYPDVQSAVASF